MSRIHLKHTHEVGRKKAVRLLKRLLKELEQEYDFAGEWEGDVLHLARSGAKGKVHVLDDAVEVDVNLGILLKPLRRTIQERIATHLDVLFPRTTA